MLRKAHLRLASLLLAAAVALVCACGSSAPPTASPTARTPSVVQPNRATATPNSCLSDRARISAPPVGLTATIDNPKGCTVLTPGTPMQANGSYSGQLGNGDLWVLISPNPNSGQYYPQRTPCVCINPPADAGKWSSTFSLGDSKSVARQWDIVLVVTDQGALPARFSCSG
jgi:hypothetical protein